MKSWYLGVWVILVYTHLSELGVHFRFVHFIVCKFYLEAKLCFKYTPNV